MHGLTKKQIDEINEIANAIKPTKYASLLINHLNDLQNAKTGGAGAKNAHSAHSKKTLSGRKAP